MWAPPNRVLIWSSTTAIPHPKSTPCCWAAQVRYLVQSSWQHNSCFLRAIYCLDLTGEWILIIASSLLTISLPRPTSTSRVEISCDSAFFRHLSSGSMILSQG
jgi:hypothetical protein